MINKIRNAFYRFMTGRNGIDQLSNFALTVSFIFLIPTLFFRNWVGIIFNTLFWLCIIYAYFRIFSKNVYKRRQENDKFISKKNYLIKRFKERKTYRYFDCPKCKTHLRVPKGAGNITITCKKCGHEFDRRA